MATDTPNEWKHKLPILTKGNHRQWFNQAKTSLEGKDIDHVLTLAYATSTFGAMQEQIASDQRQWKRDNANAKLLLLSGLDDFDQEDVEEMKLCKEIWDHLKTKYTDKRAATALTLLRELTNYTMKEDQKIVDAWGDIKNKRRHLKVINEDVAKAFKEDQLFTILLESLPEAYTSMADSMATSTTSITEKLQKLEDKEDSLTRTEQGMAAYRRTFKKDHGRCFLCDGPHFLIKCKWLKRAKSYVKDQEKKGFRHRKTSESDSTTSSSKEEESSSDEDDVKISNKKPASKKSKKSKKSNESDKPRCKCKKQQAHIADASDPDEQATFALYTGPPRPGECIMEDSDNETVYL